jgi:hypothetical protein
MIDCCKFIIDDVLKKEGHLPINRVFKDYRDKQSIFYLTGNESLLDTNFKKDFDPIKSSRAAGTAKSVLNCIKIAMGASTNDCNFIN